MFANNHCHNYNTFQFVDWLSYFLHTFIVSLSLVSLFQRATVSCTIKALEIMSEETGGCGGAVINLSSMLALKHHSQLPVYSATKAAVLQFSNSLGVRFFNM